MKLKTLKDFGGHISDNSFCDCKQYSHNNHLVRIKDLKKEAIKWVKNCRCNRQGQVCQGCIRFKIFFNITEEDLK